MPQLVVQLTVRGAGPIWHRLAPDGLGPVEGFEREYKTACGVTATDTTTRLLETEADPWSNRCTRKGCFETASTPPKED